MRNAPERDGLKKNEGEENAFLSSQYTDLYFHLSLCLQGFLQKWDEFIYSIYFSTHIFETTYFK